MNSLSSHFVLVDVKIRTSYKDLPVLDEIADWSSQTLETGKISTYIGLIYIIYYNSLQKAKQKKPRNRKVQRNKVNIVV